MSILSTIVNVPGSKSYTNRALIASALANGRSKIINPSDSHDTLLLISALRKLGVEIEVGSSCLEIFGLGGNFNPLQAKINIGLAGTALRFLLPLCSIASGVEAELNGSERMKQRPIEPLVTALRKLGAEIRCLEQEDAIPLEVKGTELRSGNNISIDAGVSSQFASGLLLSAPYFSDGLQMTLMGEIVSLPYLEMTMQVMNSFGVEVDFQQERLVVPKAKYRASEFVVESDASSATYIFSVAALTQKELTVRGLKLSSLQADIGFLAALKRMGCHVEQNTDGVSVLGPHSLRAIDIDMTDMPDSAPSLAVLASFANGTSHLTGLSTLRDKESDRIAALQAGFESLGIEVKTGKDSITITGGVHREAKIDPKADHRIAMAFATALPRVPGMQIESKHVVDKSFPKFWEVMEGLGIK
ncbi:MAG: 3-phosphoshikimate 1-carboxyvinyltransferase [Deltaproteobacteria bacterium]|nr:3-phosphoshikimate 1-carboxyvinyltransferase [Deltaproteobacteria bacterium]